MAASPLAFALMSCNTIFPHMTLVPPELPSLHWCPECVSVGKSLCMSPLREMSAIPAAPRLTQPHFPRVFYSQKLWEFSFSILVPWAGEPGVGPGPLALLGEDIRS